MRSLPSEAAARAGAVRAGAIAAGYVYFIAGAGSAEVSWLAHEILARFRRRLTQVTQATINAMAANGDGPTVAAKMAMMDRQIAFWLDRQRIALQKLTRLAGGAMSLSDVLYYDAARFAKQENARVVRDALGVTARALDRRVRRELRDQALR